MALHVSPLKQVIYKNSRGPWVTEIKSHNFPFIFCKVTSRSLCRGAYGWRSFREQLRRAQLFRNNARPRSLTWLLSTTTTSSLKCFSLEPSKWFSLYTLPPVYVLSFSRCTHSCTCWCTYLLVVSREATGIRPSVKIDTTNPGERTVLNAAPDGEIARTANWTHFTGWCSSCPSNIL